MGFLLSPFGGLLCLGVTGVSSLCVESPMVSVGTQVSLLREHGGHSLGLLFSLSLVEAKDG